MAEYIDKQAAVSAVKEVIGNLNHECKSMMDFYSALWNVPAADVAPVVHARWVRIYENGEPAIEQHQTGVCCSKCMKMPKDKFTESDYCSSCGAKMDGGDNNGH